MSVIETLSKARTILETEGWIQGSYHANEGYCLVGAVTEANKAFRATSTYPHLIQSAIDTGYEFGPFIFDDTPLFDWNDEPNRTKEEVLALIDATIARLESEG